MLRVPLDLSPVDIYKGLGVTQASTEKCLELVLRDQNRGFRVMSPLVVLPAEAGPVPKERRGKGNSGRPRGSSDSKVVLTLLTEVVAVHVGLFAVYVRGTGLQLLPRQLGDDGNRGGSGSGSLSLQNGLKNPLQVIFRVLGDTSISGRLWRLFGNF